eukprot:CAMPEP_0180518062 /NCGR_PEP_ID=MMETSP1036_2-20121128/54882_1 /TAXON_ID=632150 /ORGANISM="Azadinium spinosum, Strain 3D9" /LENGTH=157 /DNA_ID=CAMNT_0022530165 /DNA_START=170 /DNA_END=638 /DNA_ORIENTATION=+
MSAGIIGTVGSGSRPNLMSKSRIRMSTSLWMKGRCLHTFLCLRAAPLMYLPMPVPHQKDVPLLKVMRTVRSLGALITSTLLPSGFAQTCAHRPAGARAGLGKQMASAVWVKATLAPMSAAPTMRAGSLEVAAASAAQQTALALGGPAALAVSSTSSL